MLVFDHLHVCVDVSCCLFAGAYVCIMSVLCCAICVRTSGPGDPGWGTGVVCVEGQRRRETG